MIEELWQELEAEATHSGRQDTISRRIVSDSTLGVFIGYEKRSDTRMLLLPLDDAECLERRSLPRTRGLEVAVRRYPNFMGNASVLTVSLIQPQFKRMFSAMVSEITMCLGGITQDEKRVSTVVNGILKWQQLLEKLAPEGLRPEAQRGLFGELHFLNEYVLTVLPPGIAVSSWVGPNGANQDFQFADCTIEIKTTISIRHELIHIANERQLDYSIIPSLFMVHVGLLDSGDDATTLPEMVCLTRLALGSDQAAIIDFEAKLLNLGYHDAQSTLYERVKYRVLTTATYHVRDDFPRIVGADLRNGVGDVSYSITVSECVHYLVDKSILMHIIESH
jgi:hypothetical protein